MITQLVSTDPTEPLLPVDCGSSEIVVGNNDGARDVDGSTVGTSLGVSEGSNVGHVGARLIKGDTEGLIDLDDGLMDGATFRYRLGSIGGITLG